MMTIREFIFLFSSDKRKLQEFIHRIVLDSNDSRHTSLLCESIRFSVRDYFSLTINLPYKKDYYIVSSDRECDIFTVNEKETLIKIFKLGFL